MMMRRALVQRVLLTGLMAGGLAVSPSLAAEKDQKESATKVAAAELGATPNVHAAGSVWLCGQPTAEDLALAKEKGVRVVLTLREENEIPWDEAKVVEELGLDFKRIAFKSPESLTDEVFDSTRRLLREAKENDQPVLVHCGSANRVGCIWLVHRMLDHGISREQAEKEAKEVGLRNEDYLRRALEYVEAQEKK